MTWVDSMCSEILIALVAFVGGWVACVVTHRLAR